MADIGVHWERCGNTPYYKTGEGLTWFFSDPFNWRSITSTTQKTGTSDEGVISVIMRAPERYDWDALKEGASLLEEEQPVLIATHNWFAELIKGKELNLSIRDLRKLFENRSPEEPAKILRGVRAMTIGQEILRPVQNQAKIVLAVPSGSGIEDRIEEVERSFSGKVVKTIVEKNPEQGLEKALAVFGIHEC